MQIKSIAIKILWFGRINLIKILFGNTIFDFKKNKSKMSVMNEWTNVVIFMIQICNKNRASVLDVAKFDQ